MANRISVEIALEGGAEIEKQLADIGQAGQKAFLDISKAAEQAGGFKNLKPEEVTQKLKDLGVTGADALNKIQGAVQTATRLETVVQGVAKVENAFAALGRAALAFGPAIVGGMLLAAKEIASFSAEITKANAEAVKLGLSITQFDKLRLSLEGAGISAQGISAGLEGVKSELDKLALQQVAADFNTLKTGVGNGSDALQRLQATAKQFTPAGTAAAEALLKLNIPLPGMAQTVITLSNTGKAVGVLDNELTKLGPNLARLQLLTGVQFKPGDTLDVAIPKIIQALQKIPDPAQRAQAALQFFKQGSAEFSQAMQNNSLSSDNFKASVTRDAQAITQAQLDVASKVEESQNKISAAWKRFDLSTVASEIINLGKLLAGIEWGIATEALTKFVTTPVANAWQWIVDTFWSVIGKVNAAAAAAAQQIKDFVTTPVANAWQWIKDTFWAVVKSLGTLGGGASPDVGGGGGHAAGGMVGGRGSGTSDSNLAWVSRGEYIVPAAAVAQPGVLALLEALRHGMGNFALGGMVRGPLGLPAFAGGGMNNVTIAFPGLPEITGLRASSGVVDELRRAAAMAQVRSGGRKPSRYT
jgi:hypothetical protein